MLDEDAAVGELALLILESLCNAVVDVVVVVVVVVSVVSIVVGVAGSVRLCLCVFSVEEFLFVETGKLVLLSLRSEARYFSLIRRILSLNKWPSNLFAILSALNSLSVAFQSMTLTEIVGHR